MKSRILHIMAALLVFAGCLRNEMQETAPVLEVSDVTLPSDYEVGEISTVIPVRSNGSWSAYLVEDCFWAEISETDHINPSRVTDDSGIRIVCKNNDRHSDRSVRLCVTSSSYKKIITVTQSGKKDRLRVTTPAVQNLVAEPEAQTISFYSNTFWTAEIKDGSTAVAELSATEGYGDGEIKVTIEPNLEMVSKTLSVIISADSLEPVEIVYNISANVQFVRPDASISYTELVSVDTSGEIAFKTNDAWTASIVGTSTIEDLTFGQEGGEKGDIVLAFSCARNTGNSVRTAIVRIASVSDPGTYADIALTQLCGFAIRLNFRNSNRPFIPATADDPEIPKTYGGRLLDNEVHNYYILQDDVRYYFTFKVAELAYYGDTRSTVFYVGKGYLKLPAIEGKRLSLVRITSGSQSKSYSICSDENQENIIPGGIGITVPAYSTSKWVLTETLPGTAYYIKVSGNSSRISDMALIYE